MAEWRYPDDLGEWKEAWISKQEGLRLSEYAAGRHVLEIGTWAGASAICMAQRAISVVTIDWYEVEGTSAEKARRNIASYGLKNVQVCEGDFHDLLHELDGLKFGFIFVDGDHREQPMRECVELVFPLLQPGGSIAFHDYNHEGYPGIKRVVDDFAGRTASICEHLSSYNHVEKKPLGMMILTPRKFA